MTLKEMVGMGLNQEKRGDPGVFIQRVPGGWNYVYDNLGVVVFVPLPAGVEPVKDVDY